MPDPYNRCQERAELANDLLARFRDASDLGRPKVSAVVKIADPVEADELCRRQTAAIVRLLRQAFELRRAA